MKIKLKISSLNVLEQFEFCMVAMDRYNVNFSIFFVYYGTRYLAKILNKVTTPVITVLYEFQVWFPKCSTAWGLSYDF